MKRLVVSTFIFALVSLLLAYMKVEECKNYNLIKQSENQINYIENIISENNDKLEKLKIEENELKENNNEKVEILNVWKNMLEEIKKNM